MSFELGTLKNYLSLFTLSLFTFLVFGIDVLAQDAWVERDLKELTVKPKRQRYRRKGNPAVELMQKVIAAKGDHQLENNDYVRYYKYQRITTGLNEATDRVLPADRQVHPAVSLHGDRYAAPLAA